MSGPRDGHQFHFSVICQGASSVVGDPDSYRDDDWVGDPFRLTVRAWSLPEACAKAARVPFPGWEIPAEDDDPAAPEQPWELQGVDAAVEIGAQALAWHVNDHEPDDGAYDLSRVIVTALTAAGINVGGPRSGPRPVSPVDPASVDTPEKIQARIREALKAEIAEQQRIIDAGHCPDGWDFCEGVAAGQEHEDWDLADVVDWQRRIINEQGGCPGGRRHCPGWSC